jgi:hypothetical protein
MRLATIAAFFFVAGTVGPALCADNEKGKLLASCLFDVEKTMLIYKTIYDASPAGMAEAERVSNLMRQSAATPQNSDAHRLSERQLEAVTRSSLHRENEIENKLMDKCMMQGGYWYNDDDCLSRDSKNERISEFSPLCWVPAPQSVTPFAR